MKKKMGKGLLLIVGILIVGGIYFYFKNDKDKTIVQHSESVSQFLNDNMGYQYYYEKSNEQEKIAYEKLYIAFLNFQKYVYIDDLTRPQIKKVYNKIISDHPEIYYTSDSLNYVKRDDYFRVELSYTYSQEEVKKWNQQIKKSTQEIIKKASQEKTPTNKMKVLYDYIIDYVTYQEGKDDQNMKSVFIDKKSVCAGYAKAYQYLLLKAGIKSTYITGMTNDDWEGHAWVMVNIDDDFYYSDPTWGDDEDNETKHHCYNNFLMNSGDMIKCYSVDEYEKTKHSLLNYYKDIGCYMEKYDRQILSHAVQLGLKNKSRVAEVKCANDSIYKQLKNNIENNYLAYYVLTENHCYSQKASYFCDDDLKIVELYY